VLKLRQLLLPLNATLDVRDRVTLRLVVTVHRCLNYRAPQYLAVHCVPLSSQRHLGSSEQNLLHVPRHRLSTYGRASAVAGPSVWKSLSDPVPNLNATEAAFRRKTFMFKRQQRLRHGTYIAPQAAYCN